MNVIIVSGRSGSGKSSALNALEDLGFYCIDNLPVTMLFDLIDRNQSKMPQEGVAVGIDVRSYDLHAFEDQLEKLKSVTDHVRVLYLDANTPTLVRRYSETRRRHPLTSSAFDLSSAIQSEKKILTSVANEASLIINTTDLSLHDLRSTIREKVASNAQHPLALNFLSFGFKHRVPADSDLMFDVRCLPNPYWVPELRALTGKDRAIQEYLSSQDDVNKMIESIASYLDTWLPAYRANNRSYLTIAIGCTGGRHRSVYVASQLAARFEATSPTLTHRDIGR